MAFLAKAKKCDLVNLATELGAQPEVNDTVIKLKTIITKSEFYEEEFVKELLHRIITDRLELEAFAKEDKEKQKEKENLEAERAAELKKLEVERETEMKKLELSLELEKVRLEAGWTRNEGVLAENEAVSSTTSIDLAKHMPKFEKKDGDIILYLSLFERQARRRNIDKRNWVSCLLPLMPTDIIELIARVSEEEFEDYELVKNMLLKRFKMNPEGFRQKFFQHQRSPEKTWRDHAYEVTNYFQGWIDGLNLTDFDGLRDLIITDQIKRRVPADVREHFVDGWGNIVSPNKLADSLDEYESARRNFRKPVKENIKGSIPGDRKNQDLPQGPRNSFTAGNRAPHWQAARRPNTEPFNRNFRERNYQPPRRSSPKRETTEQWKRPHCYACGSLEHLRSSCPTVGRRAPAAVNRVEIDVQSSPAEEVTSREREEAPELPQMMTAKITVPVTTPIDPKKSINELKMISLRCGKNTFEGVVDSGAQISVIRADLAEDSPSDGEGKIKIVSAFGETELAQLKVIRMKINDGLHGEVPVTCAVSERLISDMLVSSSAFNALNTNVELEDKTQRELHFNKLRPYIARIEQVGLIFEQDQDFGEIFYAPTKRRRTSTNDVKDHVFNNIETLNEEQRIQLFQTLNDYKEVFSSQPGRAKMDGHSIKVTSECVPKKMQPYRVPIALQTEVERQVKELLEQGLIEESDSEWAHPVVCVAKKDGSVRLCVDFRVLNSYTIPDAYPMKHATELLYEIGSAPFISVLDLTKGYWQIPMNEEAKPFSAFVTHSGHYQWNVLPFGLKNAGSTFQKSIDKVLKAHRKYCRAYIDDLAIFSHSWNVHLLHIKEILITLQAAGLTVNLKKCDFGKNQVKFLGHIVGSGKHAPDPNKIEVMKTLSRPVTKKELRGILGLASYYRDYIKDFSSIVLPLTNLTKKRVPNKLPWSDEEEASFQKLKLRLAEIPFLYTPILDRPYQLYTDASMTAVGACLAQQDEEGKERPIAFFSKKLTPCQTRWATIEREAFAVLSALKKFDTWVFGAQIQIISDHNPLTYLTQGMPQGAKLARWALALQRYNLTITYRKGSKHGNADALSRIKFEES